LRTGDYLSLPAHEQRFDLLVSYSVLEHVADPGLLFRAFRSAISRSGLIYAAVDYRDHRRYTVNTSRWQYLLDDSDHAPHYINKVRHSGMLRLAEAAGFSVAHSRVVHEEPPRQELERFLPHYRSLSYEDITITEAHLLLTPA
jgi:2-polyprenyl-3-methyl-5-hydroxy-6-metoxy-1,4-benzoquinol methylase